MTGGPPEGDNVILLPTALGQPLPVLPDGAPEEGVEDLPPEELGPPPPHLLTPSVEALLLAADGPVTVAQIDTWLSEPGQEDVHQALLAIQNRQRTHGSGMQLVEVAHGWQLRTDVRFARWVAAMKGGRPVRLSRAALEALSIVAYRQPVTRGEVEELRGVDSGGVLRMLSERGLVRIEGRQDAPGRPLLYGTTPDFLGLFGLRDLSELPTLRDLRELQRDDPREAPTADPDQIELDFE